MMEGCGLEGRMGILEERRRGGEAGAILRKF